MSRFEVDSFESMEFGMENAIFMIDTEERLDDGNDQARLCVFVRKNIERRARGTRKRRIQRTKKEREREEEVMEEQPLSQEEQEKCRAKAKEVLSSLQPDPSSSSWVKGGRTETVPAASSSSSSSHNKSEQAQYFDAH
eukprot:scaffold3963_cov65-Cylindrotheca_fusiformis.AAC.4